MPQGPAHLHEKFGDDGVAWEWLESRGFTHNKGVIKKPHAKYVLTDADYDAIDYLILEWDWDYDVLSNG